MTALATLLTAALAAGAIAAPAAAQTTYPYPYPQPTPTYPPGYYPPDDYPPEYGYQNQGVGTIGAVIDSLLGNRYNVSDRKAVSRCASAAVSEASNRYRSSGWNAYSQGYNGPGGYNGWTNMRVTAITDVQRRSSGVRVKGLLDSGMRYGIPGFDRRRYGNTGDLSFSCKVDYRGYVTNVQIRSNDWRRY